MTRKNDIEIVDEINRCLEERKRWWAGGKLEKVWIIEAR